MTDRPAAEWRIARPRRNHTRAVRHPGCANVIYAAAAAAAARTYRPLYRRLPATPSIRVREPQHHNGLKFRGLCSCLLKHTVPDRVNNDLCWLPESMSRRLYRLFPLAVLFSCVITGIHVNGIIYRYYFFFVSSVRPMVASLLITYTAFSLKKGRFRTTGRNWTPFRLVFENCAAFGITTRALG